MHIELSVSGQRLRREMGPGIVGGSRYYLTAHVAFAGHDWDGCQVWLCIDKDGAQNAYLLDENGCVTAERGINLPAGQYTMSLMGMRDNMRITTNEVPLCVLQSGADGGDPLPEVPQTAAEQIALLAQEAVDTARSVRKDADAGRFDGADGVSAKHRWDGSVLTITSASGTSSADLRGPQGPEGKQGPQGVQGQAGKDAPQDAVRYGAQALDEAQQAIARWNIGSASEEELSRVKDDMIAETRRAQEAEDNRIKKFYTSNLGANTITDSDDGSIRNLVIGGRCEQGDNPSPYYPQEIKCVEGCTMTVSSADGSHQQEASIPVTLRGIGDVRDELYVYADGTGKLVQRIKHRIISEDDDIFISGLSTDDYKNFGIRSITDLLPQGIYGISNIISNRFSKGKRQAFNVENTAFAGGKNNDIIYFCVSAELAQTPDDFRTFCANNQVYVLYQINQIETVLTAEQTKAMYNLRTHYGGTNITYASDNGVEPVVNFDYACALDAFVEYVKAQQGDTREMIYNMDDRLTQAEVTALEAAIDAQIAQAMMEV